VRTRGRQSLHRVWDSELVTLTLHTRNRQRPPPDIDALATEARSLLVDGGQGSPDSWASESNHLARNVAYNFPGFACDCIPAGIVVLDGAYQQDAQEIIRERLLLAGARLAGVLNQTLAPAPSGAAKR
jgi:S1/P1 Nuclease